MIEYICPLRGDKKSVGSDNFLFEASIKSQRPLHTIYSPSHTVTVSHQNERQALVRFEGNYHHQDRDLQLYWSTANKDVGLTALFHRPNNKENGHFLLLISPRAELARQQEQPRDMVFVLDTSGSMQGNRIIQARNALKFCLRQLGSRDRFAVVQFATSVNKWQERLVDARPGQIRQATAWVDRLEANGSTNINDALLAALNMRSRDPNRTFTVVFFTDGQPTISETDPKRILQNVTNCNTSQTRIFTFGVGDDVNTVLLDQLAEQTRSVCTYVRETEDIESKVSNLYSKISHPVLTNLKLNVGENVRISEVYPPQLPDLFHGGQLVVLGRYSGRGHTAVTLTGSVEGERKEFTYEVRFPGHTGDDKAFVENLWARRKVGYLLDQIRIKGSNKELVDEVTTLAKKHGITTPYTSYLVVPDAAPQVATGQGWGALPASSNATPVMPAVDWAQYYRSHGYQINAPASPPPPPGSTAPSGGGQHIQFAPVYAQPQMTWAVPGGAAPARAAAPAPVMTAGRPIIGTPDPMPAPNASTATTTGPSNGFVSGVTPASTFSENLSVASTLTVDYAQALAALRQQSQTGAAISKRAAGRTFVNMHGFWIDDGVDGKQTTVKVKALSKAYFRILERQSRVREVFQLGTHVVFVTPSQSVLVITPNEGVEEMSDEAIDRLFATKK